MQQRWAGILGGHWEEVLDLNASSSHLDLISGVMIVGIADQPHLAASVLNGGERQALARGLAQAAHSIQRLHAGCCRHEVVR
jgi:hypothetical protein